MNNFLLPDFFVKSVLQLKLSQPSPDELGYADSVSVEEIGGARVNNFLDDYSIVSKCTFVLILAFIC